MLLIDFYFLKSWMNFVREKKWNAAAYQVPFIFAGIIYIVMAYMLLQRNSGIRESDFSAIIYIIATIWYFPKIFVIPFIAIKDLIKFIKKRINNSGNRTSETKQGIKENAKRRAFLQTAGWLSAGIPFYAVAKGMLKTTYDFMIYETHILFDNLPEAFNGLKIVQLSDIHAGSFPSKEIFNGAVSIVNSIKPDLVMLTGDFVNFHYKELPYVIEGLENIESKYGVFACLGNHDHYSKPDEQKKLHAEIRRAGIELLINENRALNINGESLQIAGSDNSSFNHFFADFDKTFAGLDDNRFTILMCHDPNNWDKEIKGKRNVDLTLSGHTHGGQVVFEMFGEVLSHVRFYYKHWRGLYSENGQYLYVNRGIGTVGPPVRVGVRPEISLLVLKKSSGGV
jgi:predicted MPP superfamily phosphohydrolase